MIIFFRRFRDHDFRREPQAATEAAFCSARRVTFLVYVYANGAKFIENSPLHHLLLGSLLMTLTPAFVALFPIYGRSRDACSTAERE